VNKAAISVLVVDDEPLVNELIGFQITQIGYRLIGNAYDGPQAIEMTHRLHPSVILMDMQMTDPYTGEDDPFAGLAAAREIQDTCPTPIIIVTAFESPEHIRQASATGVGAYLVKPVTEGDLERAITVALARHEDILALRRANTKLANANAQLQEEIHQRQMAEAAINRRDAVLQTAGTAAELLVQNSDWSQVLPAILTRLGYTTSVSRVYLFENYIDSQGIRCTGERFEWVAPGISSLLNNPERQRIEIESAAFYRWSSLLSRGESIAGPVRLLPLQERILLEPQETRSTAVVPVFVNQEWWGFIGLDDCLQEREWTPAEINALKVISGTLGGAIQRQQAEQALARRASELVALYATSLEINSQHDLSTLLKSIVARLCGLIGARMGGLYLLENDQTLHLVVNYNLSGDYRDVVLQPGEGLSGKIAQSGEVLIVDDYHTWPGRSSIYEETPFHRTIGMPLKSDEHVIGVIFVTDDHQGVAFSPDEIRLAGLFADQAAIAVENARLYQLAQDELAERTRTAEALKRQIDIEDLAARISTHLININLNELEGELTAALQTIAHMVGADRCHIDLFAEDTWKLQKIYDWSASVLNHSGLQIGDDLATYPWSLERLQRLEAIHVPDLEDLAPEASAEQQVWKAMGLQSVLIVPLVFEKKLVGFFGLNWRRKSDEAHTHTIYLMRMMGEAFVNALHRKHYEEHLIYLSTHDQATGLYNYAYFETEINRLQRSRRFPVSIFIADADDLKKINDNLGHAAGDEYIKRAANIIRLSFRNEDIVARIGGDEFGVILPATPVNIARQALLRLRQNLIHDSEQNPDLPTLRISIGVATAEQDQDLQRTVKLADARMYREKRKHKRLAAGLLTSENVGSSTHTDQKLVSSAHARRPDPRH